MSLLGSAKSPVAKRAVEIHADELRPERTPHARKQLHEHSINVGVAVDLHVRYPGRSTWPGLSWPESRGVAVRGTTLSAMPYVVDK